MKSIIIHLEKIAMMLTIIMFASAVTLQAQDKKDKTALVKSIVESKSYVFAAETAQPTTGRFRQLSFGYQLDVTKDTLIADLPYFGRAYTAPIDPAQGGIHFTSTEFEYTSTPKKKGGWSILIKPKGNADANQMSLDISTSGRASLQVVGNNRQPISFNGYVTERKKI